jgi:hypothetical protein
LKRKYQNNAEKHEHRRNTPWGFSNEESGQVWTEVELDELYPMDQLIFL